MKSEFKIKLQKINDDFEEVIGKSPHHFFCPILLKDEKAELCQAHIINQAFPNSPRAWTIQRKDVDNFYGTNFEADFIALRYRENYSIGDAITNKELSNILSPKILVDNQAVDYFIAHNGVPKQFTSIEFDNNGKIILLGLKMHPNNFLSLAEKEWEISAEKDIRVAALVSLLKAAHLTLFEILGYHYALSMGGRFIGEFILGEFFRQNYQKAKKAEIQNSAYIFFKGIGHMARPVISLNPNMLGTITDKQMFVCKDDNGSYWAFVIFIRVMDIFHSVLVPIANNLKTVGTFLNFLQNDNETLHVSLCQFHGDHWKISTQTLELQWPKTGILYPEQSP